MGGVRTAPEEGGTMNTAVGVCLWLCSAAVVTGLTVLCLSLIHISEPTRPY